MWKNFIIFLIAFESFRATFARRDFHIVHRNCSSIDTHPAVTTNCSIFKLDNGQVAISFYIDLRIEISNYYGHVEVSLVKPSSKETFTLFNSTSVNYCEILNSRSKKNLVGIFIEEMRNNGHLPERCPPVNAEVYFVKNLVVNTENLPPYTPDARYSSKMVLYSKINGTPYLMTTAFYEGEVRRIRKRVGIFDRLS